MTTTLRDDFDIATTVQQLTDGSFSEWEAAAGALTEKDRATIARYAYKTAILSARLSAYMDAFGLERDHDVAVKYQNRVAAKVRKALGYLEAHNDITF